MALLGGSAEARAVRVRLAWQNVAEGRATPEDGLVALAHLAVLTGYFEAPSLENYLKATKSAAGYETHLVEAAGKRNVFVRLLPFLDLDHVAMREVEKLVDEIRIAPPPGAAPASARKR